MADNNGLIPRQREAGLVRVTRDVDAISIIKEMRVAHDEIAATIAESQKVIGKAAGEIKTIFKNLIRIEPNGTTEIDLSTIVTITTDGSK